MELRGAELQTFTPDSHPPAAGGRIERLNAPDRMFLCCGHSGVSEAGQEQRQSLDDV